MCDEAAMGCIATPMADAPCDDGDVCTEDTCTGSTCGHEPISFAHVDASFGAALAAPLCENERVPRGVEKALMKARKRIAQATDGAEPRRAKRLGQGVQKLERARERILRSKRVSVQCAASVEAMVDALRLRAGCLER
jgi:hypothetical protein